MHKTNHNPWMSMWTNPRSTIKEMLKSSPTRGFFALAVIFGLQYLLNLAQSFSLGSKMNPLVILILCIVLSPIAGIIWFYFFGACLHWTGRLFKGKASHHELRSVVMWSTVPFLISLAMWVILLLTSFSTAFIQKSTGVMFLLVTVIGLIASLWSVVLMIFGLKEVQNYNYWKAIGNYILSAILYFIVVFVLSTIVVYVLGFITKS